MAKHAGKQVLRGRIPRKRTRRNVVCDWASAATGAAATEGDAMRRVSAADGCTLWLAGGPCASRLSLPRTAPRGLVPPRLSRTVTKAQVPSLSASQAGCPGGRCAHRCSPRQPVRPAAPPAVLWERRRRPLLAADLQPRAACDRALARQGICACGLRSARGAWGRRRVGTRGAGQRLQQVLRGRLVVVAIGPPACPSYGGGRESKATGEARDAACGGPWIGTWVEVRGRGATCAVAASAAATGRKVCFDFGQNDRRRRCRVLWIGIGGVADFAVRG